MTKAQLRLLTSDQLRSLLADPATDTLTGVKAFAVLDERRQHAAPRYAHR